MSQDLAGLTLVELATAIADGSITSVAATTWSLERLRRIGPQLNCIAVLSDDTVLSQAETLDQLIDVVGLCDERGSPYAVLVYFNTHKLDRRAVVRHLE
jgi:Asp-tRNA(Asn)/Glu-tRNA(Gln) amidotransferase A subunit family amidase